MPPKLHLTHPSLEEKASLKLFKGIALFTPGGDLVYCIDPTKRSQWHLHLCATLQELLDLPEPPHFLVPCYTATIDRWLDPYTQQVKVSAEAYAPVLRYQPLLNAIFETDSLVWQPISQTLGSCDPLVLATYRSRFPQLWEEHDLVIGVNSPGSRQFLRPTATQPEVEPLILSEPEAQGYVLRLFVSGYSAATERILQELYQLLERSLAYPYTLKVIDIYKHPEQAEADQVSATPTLVRVWPRPVRKIVGNLEDATKILQILGATQY
ncbi:circadian clock protein KaiB [Desertifilum sp. FACHB-1129]|uniref:Circadian clock protein KaiB n=2 Tax=Desertifilum tharense IPPAS B-1220 TaxID=1781255 RepID=A0A1E5QGJ2_9CYAN|nr:MULTISPECIES: circadian clock KaiB family protein [Desertifilum]MCD8485713.1 circadian clock KaiB family protein [Desertifilum sp.]MDA0210384.1 circadian clock KaiB family protein [Cyanobacteria bacterium FC1]MBD2310332.1 circadian clock protein KaiB [Desertifilum sp. FACHB-1129]MBD2322708.1 circadian clock protein KaiB [Desertifilum sp. FACHB-866]MBD2333586.1 circadian clock protein KaiB [Desertifilum sp. FACHB-868]